MAEILDRIAGDYLLLDDWMRAKPYSDASWSLFRELDLLEKPEAFPAYQRRGVILCHAGEVAEGLALLHQAENFIYRFEPLPIMHNLKAAASIRKRLFLCAANCQNRVLALTGTHATLVLQRKAPCENYMEDLHLWIKL